MSQTATLQLLLQTLRSKGRLLDQADTIYLIKEVAARLDQSTLFGDLSPALISVAANGEIGLVGLGRGKVEVTSLDSPERLRYLSPERIQNQPPNAASDVFALGLVFWRLLFGRDLFADSVPGELIEKISQFSSPQFPTTRELAPDVRRVLSKMLAVNPVDRLSPKAVHTELGNFLKRDKPGYAQATFSQRLAPLQNVATQDPLGGILTGNREVDLAPLPVYQPPFAWKRWLFVILVITAAGAQRYYTQFQTQGTAAVGAALKTDLKQIIKQSQAKVEEWTSKDVKEILMPGSSKALTKSGAAADAVTAEASTVAAITEGATIAPAGGEILSLKLQTVPSGAAIYKDGQLTTYVTPVQIDVSADQTLSLNFRLEGYRDCPALVSPRIRTFICRLQPLRARGR
ncbi:MAG: protein kinase [Bdellovibrionales bacterium]